jgi:hypothetical protein
MAVPSGPRYPYWIEEQASTYRGPTMSRLLFLAILAVVLAVALAGGPLATARSGGQVSDRDGPSFCEAHKGEPAWDSICAEARRW